MAWFAAMGFALFGIGNGLAITGLALAGLGYASDAIAGADLLSVIIVFARPDETILAQQTSQARA